MGIGDAAESGDHFGAALTTGDYNGDGYADIAVGVPGEDLSSMPDAGAVVVLFGSPGRLTHVGHLFLTPTVREPGAQFGFALR